MRTNSYLNRQAGHAGKNRACRRLVAVLTCFAGSTLIAAAAVNDLWITEVNPATGEVEVTNVGGEPFTVSSPLPFCHRFNYATSIPSGTTFNPGQSRVFVLSGLNATDSDLWLYRNFSFGSAASMISGLKYGPQANVGRTGLASSGGLWNGAGSFVPVPPAGQSLQLTGPNPFSSLNWSAGSPNLGTFSPPRVTNLVELIVTIENLAPANGTYLTPLWVGFHDGAFDFFNAGSTALTGLERIAEDGVTGNLAAEFLASGAGAVEGTLIGIGPIAPGARVQKRFTVDANSPSSRYFSYASMIIPSNDAFIGNDNAHQHLIFDTNGSFIGARFEVPGSAVNDAGTEVNDELPANTAFFGQMTPDTGTVENGTVMTHPGFKAPGSGGILDDARFTSGDFKAAGYRVARISVEQVSARPVTVRVTARNPAPEHGNYLTPVWIGFHNGAFDLFNLGAPASAGLESLAEDGATALLTSAFNATNAGSVSGVLDLFGPIAPGAAVSRLFTLDGNASRNRYLSYASMIIPSNDGFVGNDDPRAHAVFDADGNFTSVRFMVAGAQGYDAGTEVNDELPANTAFFGQTTPNTGANENGAVHLHPGFKPADSGGIVDDPRFANANFTGAGRNLLEITVELAPANPVDVVVKSKTSHRRTGLI